MHIGYVYRWQSLRNALIRLGFTRLPQDGVAGKHSMPARVFAMHNSLQLAFIGRRLILAETIDGN
ncbi:protein of unknown function [Caballeronia sp. S22]